MFWYVIGGIALSLHAVTLTMQDEVSDFTTRIAVGIVAGPLFAIFIASVMSGRVGRWVLPAPGKNTTSLYMIAGASWVAFSMVQSTIPDFETREMRMLVALASGPFYGITAWCLLKMMREKTHRDDARVGRI